MEKMMKKIKVLKIHSEDAYGCDECQSYGEDRRVIDADTDWQEVDDETYSNLVQLCDKHNRFSSASGVQFNIIEYISVQELRLELAPLMEQLKKEAEENEKKARLAEIKRQEAAAKKAETALERKQKQLAKLQAELGKV